MKILITGINGFVGSNLFNALHQQYSIYGLDIAPNKNDQLKLFSWDELEEIPQVDVVVHLAGMAHDTKNQTESEKYFAVNTELTKKIYNWFLTSGAKKFIYFSSVKAVADIVKNEYLTEDVIPEPKGPYGESKLAAENLILKNTPENRDVYIIRPCMIHGPGNKGNLNLLYKLIQKKIPWPLGKFDNKRSFCSIDNLIFVIENLIKKAVKSGVYNMADDQPLSTNELIKLISFSQNKQEKILNINKRFIKILASFGDVFRLPFNNERLKKLTENYIVSNQKIKSSLEIEKLPYSAAEGLSKTLNSFNEQL